MLPYQVITTASEETSQQKPDPVQTTVYNAPTPPPPPMDGGEVKTFTFSGLFCQLIDEIFDSHIFRLAAIICIVKYIYEEVF